MFLIYKSWYSSMTSMRELDCGYEISGYVETEEEAKEIVDNGGIDERPYPHQPMFMYKKVSKYIAP